MIKIKRIDIAGFDRTGRAFEAIKKMFAPKIPEIGLRNFRVGGDAFETMDRIKQTLRRDIQEVGFADDNHE